MACGFESHFGNFFKQKQNGNRQHNKILNR